MSRLIAIFDSNRRLLMSAVVVAVVAVTLLPLLEGRVLTAISVEAASYTVQVVLPQEVVAPAVKVRTGPLVHWWSCVGEAPAEVSLELSPSCPLLV